MALVIGKNKNNFTYRSSPVYKHQTFVQPIHKNKSVGDWFRKTGPQSLHRPTIPVHCCYPTHSGQFTNFTEANYPTSQNIFGVWEETGVPGENPVTESKSKLHTESTRSQDQTRPLALCHPTALTLMYRFIGCCGA